MTQEFKGFPPRPHLQGYSPIPNVFFDEVLPKINNMSELKILLAVFRKTYGWVKEIDQQTGQPIYKLEDAISYSQFEDLTGLSSTSIATGLTRSINDGYLEKIQQGNYSGVTSSYRIVTEGGEKAQPPKPTPPATPQEKTSPPKYFQMDNTDVEVPKGPLGKSLADLTGSDSYETHQLSNDKQAVLDEIFGSRSKPKEEKKKPEKTPHQDFISKWFAYYYSKFNLSYGTPTGKEHGHIKSLLKDYDMPTLVRAMEFYFTNYKSLEGVPSEFPTITIFYSWRKKIIPASLHGIVTPSKPRNSREFEEGKWEKGEDFFD